MKLFIDMDGVLCNYDKAYQEKRIPGFVEYPQSQARFFENLEEIEGSRLALDTLMKTEYDIWIASSPSVKNPYSYSEKRVWLEEHYGDYNLHEKLILIPDKSLLRGDILIDDNLYTNGQNDFPGSIIYFNSHHIPQLENIIFISNSWFLITNKLLSLINN
jgi:5'-nucleotidase